VVGVAWASAVPALPMVEPLAKVLGAATCVTRDVADAGWLERQYQVGFTDARLRRGCTSPSAFAAPCTTWPACAAPG
jgi:hypothetical protein